MSSIGGVGNYNPLAATYQRNRDRFGERDHTLFKVEATAPQLTAQRTIGLGDEQDARSYEEAFARLRVVLQSRSGTDLEVPSGQLSGPVQSEPDTAVQAFRDYMAMTPAEKMRDAILRNLGLSEEEVDAMPPEQQEAIEMEIAERMKQRADLQAAREIEKGASGGDEEDRKLLLS